MRYPHPHTLQLFYFNDRLEFCEFFEWKIKIINNADLFSQPPLLTFTKSANISVGHGTCLNQFDKLFIEWTYKFEVGEIFFMFFFIIISLI